MKTLFSFLQSWYQGGIDREKPEIIIQHCFIHRIWWSDQFQKYPLSVETTVRSYDKALHSFLTMIQKQQNESRDGFGILLRETVIIIQIIKIALQV